MTANYEGLLRLCGMEADEIERQAPRIEKVFNRIGIGSEDIENAEKRVREQHDVELLGVRKLLRAWMLDSMPPSTYYHQRFGHWVGEEQWPSEHIQQLAFQLDEYRLVAAGAQVTDRALGLQSPLGTGLFAGKWCSYSAVPDLPHDQREEDGGALVFNSEPLAEDVQVLGAPALELELSASEPVAMVAVRHGGR